MTAVCVWQEHICWTVCLVTVHTLTSGSVVLSLSALWFGVSLHVWHTSSCASPMGAVRAAGWPWVLPAALRASPTSLEPAGFHVTPVSDWSPGGSVLCIPGLSSCWDKLQVFSPWVQYEACHSKESLALCLAEAVSLQHPVIAVYCRSRTDCGRWRTGYVGRRQNYFNCVCQNKFFGKKNTLI